MSSSLDLGYVYVLDAGMKLFVWCGNKSSLMARSKARLICEKINKYERKNKATIMQMRAVSAVTIGIVIGLGLVFIQHT